MTNTTLIPGNQYKIPYLAGIYHFVGYTTDQYLVFQNVGRRSIVTKSYDTKCTPYSPPVVHKRYLRWYKYNKNGEVYCTTSCAPWIETLGYTLLSETIVTYTEEK